MTTNQQIVKTDGRGLLAGDYIQQDRPMTRELWLSEVFPEWGTFLNQQIEKTVVPRGKVTLWWLGGPSWVLKTSEGGVYLIDSYAGPSHYTRYYYCGVCAQTGAESIDWLRLNPQVIDPWGFNRLDGVFCTHHHADHCDIYTIKAALQTSECKFYAPAVAAERIKGYGVPENRVVVTRPGCRFEVPGAEVEVLVNYDLTAIRTGTDKPYPFEEVASSFLFKTDGGNILFLGDTWYHNGYRAVGEKYDIDVAIFDMGHNAPGGTDKMTPYDCFRIGEALGAKVLIPDHYDNWANTARDPELLVSQFERIVKENDPNIKTVILRCGARFTYPDDKDIGRYKYPDWRERYRTQYSKEYGSPPEGE